MLSIFDYPGVGGELGADGTGRFGRTDVFFLILDDLFSGAMIVCLTTSKPYKELRE